MGQEEWWKVVDYFNLSSYTMEIQSIEDVVRLKWSRVLWNAYLLVLLFGIVSWLTQWDFGISKWGPHWLQTAFVVLIVLWPIALLVSVRRS